MWWLALADAILVVHLAYLAFIPLGGFLALRWPRLVPVHVVATVVGLVSITIGFDCPLTTWEQHFRGRGGERPYRDGFVKHYLTGHVYPHGYDWLVQVVFGVAVVGSYVLVVRSARRRRAAIRETPAAPVPTPHR